MVLLNNGDVAFRAVGSSQVDTPEAAESINSYFSSSLGKDICIEVVT